MINAAARLKATAIRAKVENLAKGVYISKEQPLLVNAPTGRAVLGDSTVMFSWRASPRMLVRTRDLTDLMKYLPAIFDRHESAKFKPELSDPQAGYCFDAGDAWIVISAV